MQFPKTKIIFTRVKRHKGGLVGGVVIFLLIFLAIFAPFVSPYSPNEQQLSESLKPPSLSHPFGTDFFGRDLLSRVIYGTRYAFFVGVISVGLGALIGTIVGTIAGYFGGIIDRIGQSLMNITWAFPAIFAGLAISAIFGPRLENVFIAMALISWARYGRIIRGNCLSLREQEFVKAARAAGVSNLKIIIRHIVPNAFAPVFVVASMGMGWAIAVEAALSFLGLGAQPPTPTWGAILSQGRRYMMIAPWITIFPGLAIVLLVLSFNLLGDALRDALDPRLKL